MAVLLVALRVRKSDDKATVVRAADALLRHLQLLFVPAGVGVVVYLAAIRHDAVPIVIALLGSWLMASWWSRGALFSSNAWVLAGEGHRELADALAGLLHAVDARRELKDRTGGSALAQPVLIAVVVVGATISLLGIDYDDYRSGTELIAFWLGPATVALAVPLHRQAHRVRGFAVPMFVAISLGAAVSVTTAVLLVRAFGGGEELARTMAPKATTTPVAIALSQTLDGIPAMSAVFAVVIGIFGAVFGPAVLTLLRVQDRRARGVALGAVSHGIGTSRALAEDETEGAFAGLSMGLTALATSILIPLLAALLL